MALSDVDFLVARDQRRHAEAQLRALEEVRTKIGPLSVPPYSPFTRPFNKSKPVRKFPVAPETYMATTASAIAEFKNQKEFMRESEHRLSKAGDTHLANLGMTGHHVDDEVRRVAQVYGARFSYLTNDLIARATNHWPHSNQSNSGKLRDEAMRQARAIQFHATGYMTDAMQDLVAASGGRAAWDQATVAERAALITYLFNQAPIACCRGAFFQEAGVVDIDRIFASHISSRREKWQVVYRSKFVNLALKVYEIRTSSRFGRKDDEQATLDKKHLFPLWKHFMSAPEVRALNLGPVEQVPTREGGRGTTDNRRVDVNDIQSVTLYI